MEETKKESMKILNYKSKLENMLKFAQHGRIDRTKENLKSILKAELEKNKITEEEYKELIDYIDNYTFEKKEENTKIEEKAIAKNKGLQQENKKMNNNEFRNSVKVKNEEMKILDAIIMYNGEIGKVAPKSDIKNGGKEIEK